MLEDSFIRTSQLTENYTDKTFFEWIKDCEQKSTTTEKELNKLGFKYTITHNADTYFRNPNNDIVICINLINFTLSIYVNKELVRYWTLYSLKSNWEKMFVEIKEELNKIK